MNLHTKNIPLLCEGERKREKRKKKKEKNINIPDVKRGNFLWYQTTSGRRPWGWGPSALLHSCHVAKLASKFGLLVTNVESGPPPILTTCPLSQCPDFCN